MNKSELPTIGILGVGKIGLSVAMRLLSAGYPVVGISREPMDAFVATGGKAVATGAELAGLVDIYIECLGNEAGFEAVVHGPQGVVRNARKGQVMIALSSDRLQFKEAQLQRLAEYGVSHIDATISGGPSKVDDGGAIIYLGGDAGLIEQCKPVLDAITPTWHHVGDHGAATKLKFVNNTLSFVHNLAAAEAMALSVKLGLDPVKVVEFLKGGTAASPGLLLRGPKMAVRKYEPVTGDFHGALIVLESILEMADEVKADLPLLRTSREYYQQGVDEGLAEHDVAELFELVLARK